MNNALIIVQKASITGTGGVLINVWSNSKCQKHNTDEFDTVQLSVFEHRYGFLSSGF